MSQLPNDFAQQQHKDRLDYILPKTNPALLVDVCTLNEREQARAEEEAGFKGTHIARSIPYGQAEELMQKTVSDELEVVIYKAGTTEVIESH